MALLQQFQGLIGIALLLLFAWVLSEKRSGRPSWRWIGAALLIQLGLALLLVRVPIVWNIVTLAQQGVGAIEKASLAGSSYMFGYLGGAALPFALTPGTAPPLIIAFQILPIIIVFSALSALLWHWGVLARLVQGLSWLLQRSMGVSGVVGLGGGANLFLGVVESPLIVRPYLERMSRSELFAIMVLAMSTISGAVLVLYASTLSRTVPDATGHLISASIISLPAALLLAKIMVPGDDATDDDDTEPALRYDGSMDAIVRGTMDGVQLFLAVIGVIIVMFALIALADQMLTVLPIVDGEAVTVRRLFGWLFAPLMWTLGVPWDQAPQAGALMGTKAILNEYVAYLDLAGLPVETFDPRSKLIVAYALCGFANLASIGLLVSTIGTLAPSRRAEVAGLGVKSWIAGNFASAMTGAIVGLISFA
ncbi:NupC/NupG family nucleoside CNT transporter [Sphingopyxis sp. EG6]|uniref:NupC/NupG family nucleoside CNT transporter n=1 Tax=Sphingopyxis sp. EG6 TaxID=1874061 RepID=UPI000DC62A04|nr:nucleoside transporter C-terminal domain-containing protein [Sphingopyxis sp. EG6]MEA3264730.1 nucleoside transporter C-terminal domain-containing protein [Pseudomonadota bacterium]BBB08527.1 Na+ dependent nucleoside transporter-like protein [Sphingopyxis sp. EG6]